MGHFYGRVMYLCNENVSTIHWGIYYVHIINIKLFVLCTVYELCDRNFEFRQCYISMWSSSCVFILTERLSHSTEDVSEFKSKYFPRGSGCCALVRT